MPPSQAAAPGKKIVNPYAASKKPITRPAPAPTPAPKAPPLAPPPLPPSVPAMDGSSFSQAFGGIEDTDYYRKEMGEGPDVQERAQQRAIDQSSSKELTDRDHHLMIQPHVLSVSTKQRGNGVLNYIRNVPLAYARMVPDYVMSPTSCALFLSCKYHSLHPNYIHKRIIELKTDFKLRVLLVLVDVQDNQDTLLELNRIAVVSNLTLILAWTEEEAARYLECYKALKDNDAAAIRRKEKTEFADQAAEYLTGCTGVNRTDAASLLSQFTTLKAVSAASRDELALIDGLGSVKVRRLWDALHKPFSTKRKRERLQKQNPQPAEMPAAVEGEKLEGTEIEDSKEQ